MTPVEESANFLGKAMVLPRMNLRLRMSELEHNQGLCNSSGCHGQGRPCPWHRSRGIHKAASVAFAVDSECCPT